MSFKATNSIPDCIGFHGTEKTLSCDCSAEHAQYTARRFAPNLNLCCYRGEIITIINFDDCNSKIRASEKEKKNLL